MSSSRPRQSHIDGLRGLAVLLMVLVHAAATWEPDLSGPWLMLGVLVSAGGGLAAPLFVALLGWGLFQREFTFSQRMWRAGFLFGCQGLVNGSAPHLFEPWTPGILSLMGAIILLEPCWRRIWAQSSRPTFIFAVFTAGMVFLMFQGDWQGPSNWDARVSTDGVFEFLQHLALTGLYPVLPWVVFAWLGITVATVQNDQRKRWFTKAFILGLGVSLLILVDSVRAARTWALPTGEASLTFFPANPAFLVAALTGTVALWLIAEQLSVFTWLSDLGRTSLTVYVLHFVPFALFHDADEIHQWSPYSSAAVAVAYTIIWALVGTWLHRQAPSFTLEACMRRFEPPS